MDEKGGAVVCVCVLVMDVMTQAARTAKSKQLSIHPELHVSDLKTTDSILTPAATHQSNCAGWKLYRASLCVRAGVLKHEEKCRADQKQQEAWESLPSKQVPPPDDLVRENQCECECLSRHALMITHTNSTARQ